MTRKEARAILGRKDQFEAGMARALAIHPWANGPSEWRRVLALRTLGYKAARNLVNRIGLEKVEWLAS